MQKNKDAWNNITALYAYIEWHIFNYEWEKIICNVTLNMQSKSIIEDVKQPDNKNKNDT